MELRHLRYFLAVAEELHFSRAAKKLHVSQPPLSKQIRELEKELGVHLFDRTSRKVELTRAGQLFAGEASIILQQLERAGGLAVEVDREKRNHIVVGYSPGTVHIIVRILRIFADRHPEVQILVKNLETFRQIEALNNGRIDVGLVTLRLVLDSEGLVIETILRDRLVVAMPTDHPLSARKVVPLRALANETLILDPLHKNQARHGLITEMCRQAGFSLHRVHEVDNLHHALELIGAGFGLSLMRASVQEIQTTGVVFRELQHSPLLETAIAYRQKNRSGALLAFVDVARDAARLLVNRSQK